MFNGQKIKDIISNKGLTQKQVFNRAGIKEATFYSLFNQTANPSSNILESIADVLGCSIDDFFDRNNDAQLINIGHNVSGNGNKVTGDIALSECQSEVAHLKELLKEKDELLNEKERLIKVLMKE